MLELKTNTASLHMGTPNLEILRKELYHRALDSNRRNIRCQLSNANVVTETYDRIAHEISCFSYTFNVNTIFAVAFGIQLFLGGFPSAE